MKPDYIVYTDGGARGNPGPAGAGAYITDADGRVLKEAHKALGRQTNNYAEYQAVILAINELKKIVPKPKRSSVEIEFRMDSELIQRQLSGKYQIKEPTLFPLFVEIWNARVSEFPHMSFQHVPREKNKDADRLSNVAMDEAENKSIQRQIF